MSSSGANRDAPGGDFEGFEGSKNANRKRRKSNEIWTPKEALLGLILGPFGRLLGDFFGARFRKRVWITFGIVLGRFWGRFSMFFGRRRRLRTKRRRSIFHCKNNENHRFRKTDERKIIDFRIMLVLFGVQRSGIDFGRLLGRFRSRFRSHFDRFSASETGSVSGAGKDQTKEQNVAAGGRWRALGGGPGDHQRLPRYPVKLTLRRRKDYGMEYGCRSLTRRRLPDGRCGG